MKHSLPKSHNGSRNQTTSPTNIMFRSRMSCLPTLHNHSASDLHRTPLYTLTYIVSLHPQVCLLRLSSLLMHLHCARSTCNPRINESKELSCNCDADARRVNRPTPRVTCVIHAEDGNRGEGGYCSLRLCRLIPRLLLGLGRFFSLSDIATTANGPHEQIYLWDTWFTALTGMPGVLLTGLQDGCCVLERLCGQIPCERVEVTLRQA